MFMYSASKSRKVSKKNQKVQNPSKFEMLKFRLMVNRRIKLAAKSGLENVKVSIPEGVRLREEIGQNSISQMKAYYGKKGYSCNPFIGSSSNGLATLLEIDWRK